MSVLAQPWPALPAGAHPVHAAWLAAESDRLLDFAEAARLPDTGFGFLDERGRLRPDRPATLLACCRLTHCFSLASLWRRPGALALAAHGIRSLSESFLDDVHGGWLSELASVGATERGGRGPTTGGELSNVKGAYGHAFVVLAAASGTIANIEGAAELLEEALSILVGRFCTDPEGLAVHEYRGDWQDLDEYRGANANMHVVEALLAASDATGEGEWLDRAATIAAVLVDRHARARGWRVPEHYDSRWNELPEFNRDQPKDVFRPYGYTPGHGFEWSRLLLQIRAARCRAQEAPEPWLLEAAQGLFGRAVDDGWDPRHGGIVYTVDASGQPVVRDRLSWVLAEAISAAAALHGVAPRTSLAAWYVTWWDFAARYLIDVELGSWRHQLDAANRPACSIFEGKPDVYHALQATLVPRLPLAGSIALPLRELAEGA